MIMVFARGMSKPFSIIVVQTRMSNSWRMNLSMVFRSEEFRQAVALGIFDDHGVRQGNVQTIFDNCRTNQDVELVAHELEHGLLQFGLSQLPVSHANTRPGHHFLYGVGALPDGIYAIVQEVDLPAAS